MSRTIGKVRTNDLAENQHKILGISINRQSNTAGAFGVNYSTIQQAKSNLINLIMTRKGERVHQPDFGCDVWKLLFEPIIEGELDVKVEQVIADAVNNWLPYLTISQIYLDYTNEDIDNHIFGVSLVFYLTSNPNIGGTVTLNINNQ